MLKNTKTFSRSMKFEKTGYYMVKPSLIILRCTIVYYKEVEISWFSVELQVILKFLGWNECSDVWSWREEQIEQNTVCGAAYWQGTHEALPFVRELLCSHALQSHVTPTQGRLVQRLQTLAWGPEFCSAFHLMAVSLCSVCWHWLSFLRCSWEHSSQKECCSTPWTPYFLQAVRQKGGLSYGWTQPGSANKLFQLSNNLVMINLTTESSKFDPQLAQNNCQ